MTERYAIYFAPDAEGPLWRRAAQWLGRDAATGADVPQQAPEAMAETDLRRLTAAPRRYGFHATLKAPMSLAAGRTSDDLVEAARHFAAGRKPFSTGGIAVRELGSFLAIMPINQSPEVTAFAADCVAHFEAFRAPMSAVDRQRRIAAGLTARQLELLDQYGYPYVMEEFRMHMTLTDSLSPAERSILFPAAEKRFADLLVAPFNIDRIAVYRELEPGAPFTRLVDLPLGAA